MDVQSALRRRAGHPRPYRRQRRAHGRHGSDRGTRRVAVSVLIVALLVVGGGAAFAAWTTSGTGSSTAKAGSALPPTTSAVSGSALTTGLLYPGATGDAQITVNNPNAYPVKLASVTSSGAASGSGGSGTCSTTGVSLASTAAPSTTIPANGSATVTLPGAASMTNSSDTGCQGATFSIPVAVTVASAA